MDTMLVHCHCGNDSMAEAPVKQSWKAWLNISLQCYTVECRYNAIQYNMIFHTPLHWLTQNINQALHSQKTLHISPSWASYGVSIVMIWEKIDRIITAPHCINWWYNHYKHNTLCTFHGPLTRYVKLQVAHAPGMPGTFSPPADLIGNR